MSLASLLPYDHPFAGGYPGLSSQALPTDADALDYLARVKAADGTGVETGVAVAVDAFVADSKALGVWDSIRASCVLAGARTLAGALVPLRDYGPELWDGTAAPLVINNFGSSGTYNISDKTFTTAGTSTSNGYPRFRFQSLGLTAGKQYRVTGVLSGDISKLFTIRFRTSTGAGIGVSPEGLIDSTLTADQALLEWVFDGTPPSSSVTIDSLSIREVIAAPTNVADGFVEGDFSRTAGLTGDGTSYIDSGRANDDDPQNDNHNAVYMSDATLPALVVMGAGGSVAGRNMINVGTSNLFTRCRHLTDLNTGLATATEGFISFSRSSSAGYQVRAFGSDFTATQPSDGVVSDNVFVFAFNSGGSPSAHSDATIAFYSIGTSLSLEDLDTAVTNLINRLKFALLVGENPSGLDPDTIDYIVRGYEAGGSLE